MRLFHGIRQLLTMVASNDPAASPLGLIEDAALGVADGRIAWVGPARDAPASDTSVDLGGVVVMPGLVDPHTHLVYAGDRAADFEARCRGETYAQIASRGGGIRTTVRSTRAASEAELEALAAPRLSALLAAGVTTVEIKSGYGLDVATEVKQLQVIASLARSTPQRLVPTLLLHMVPDELATEREAWIARVRDELLPAVTGLAEAVDVFCDVGAFTRAESLELLRAARAAGFAVKAHVEQLSATGFGADAAALGARSLEHLEQASPEVIAAMAAAGTVAVLLPGASIFLGDATRPPVAALREAGVAMALGTDLNPGSSPTFDPWLVATLACTQYRMTPAESLLGLTDHAARALGRDDVGALAVGSHADFIVAPPGIVAWPQLLYGFGHRPIARVFIGGVEISDRGSAGLAEVTRDRA